MLKNKILGLGCTLASIFLITSSAIALHPISDVSLLTGWRSDEIKTSTNFGDDYGFGRNQVKLKNLDTWEFGIRGQYAFTGFCGCEESFLDDLYIKGSAIWGWGDNGKFHFGNSSSGYSGYSGDYAGTTFGSIHARNTRTYDYDIGLGWLYAIDCNWGIGPTVGYAWNRITTHPKRHHQHDSYSSSSYSYDDVGAAYAYSSHEHFEYSTKWYGPWLGLELDYEDCEWHFDLGYEFHWARNKTRFMTDDNHRSHDSRYGNVVYVDGWYDLCDGWEVGVGFKYRSFQSGRKHHHHDSYSYSSSSDSADFAYAGDYSTGGRGGRTTWNSWGFTLDLGYRF